MKGIKVSTEMKKLKTLLKQVPADRLCIAQSLYKELVFMQNTLESLRTQVETEGAVSMFKQGRQEFMREHPALKGYNTTIQRYNLIFKQFTDLLPPAKVEETDELMEFIQ